MLLTLCNGPRSQDGFGVGHELLATGSTAEELDVLPGVKNQLKRLYLGPFHMQHLQTRPRASDGFSATLRH